MTDDDVITLKQAAEVSGIGIATLRAEANRGRLTIYRIGRQNRTTVKDIRVMVELCRVEPKAPVFIATQRAINTSSETAAASLDLAREAALRLKRPLRPMSLKSTARSQVRGR